MKPKQPQTGVLPQMLATTDGFQAVMTANEVRNERVNIKNLAYCLLCHWPFAFSMKLSQIKKGDKRTHSKIVRGAVGFAVEKVIPKCTG